MADCVFVMLLFCSRFLYFIGPIMGAKHYGFVGLFPGLAVGTLAAFCMGRSLGLRGRDLTKGFHFRMFERGNGKRAGILEALVEVLRGNRLTITQCRRIGTSYSEASRELQSCDSTEERVMILAKRDRQILAIAYGVDSIATSGQSIEQTELVQIQNAGASPQSGIRADSRTTFRVSEQK